MEQIAAIAASLILGALCLFQFALILGLPLGKFAWGGGHTILPVKLRLSSVFSIALYLLFALVILQKAEVISFFAGTRTLNIAMWVITAYLWAGILLNVISRSRPERLVMTPVAIVLAILFLIVALS